MMRYCYYILLLLLSASCLNNDLEERWKNELEYAESTSKMSFQTVNKYLKDEENEKIKIFRNLIFRLQFDKVGKESLDMENKLNHCNSLCDAMLFEIENLDLAKDLDYAQLRKRVGSMRDSLVQFIASYTDDKGMDYAFDPTEINENEAIEKQLRYSNQIISPIDTMLIREIYNLLKLPKTIRFEENDTGLDLLQKQLFLNGVRNVIEQVRSKSIDHFLSKFYFPCGFCFHRIVPIVLAKKQVYSRSETLAFRVKMCDSDTLLRDENYYSFYGHAHLFSENSLPIKVTEKGFQPVTGTLGIAQKGVLIQKPWSYVFYGK